MQTKFWRLDDKNQEQVLKEAAEIIKSGGIVAFPTETVYGLGANGLSQGAVEKIFIAKGRPADNPLILHIVGKEQVHNLVAEVSEDAQKLIDIFWPGPLTIIFKKKFHIPDAVTTGLGTVAIRMPSHELANRFIALCGVPLAAPSANVSGRPSPTEAQAVKADLWGKVDGIIDGGSTDMGLESTVIDCSKRVPVILRPGWVTKEQIKQVICLNEVICARDIEAPKAPGMKYIHYAPKAPVYLFSEQINQSILSEVCARIKENGFKIGIVTNSRVAKNLPSGTVIRSWSSYEQLANNLYAWLRELDNVGVNVILAQQMEEQGLGTAIMNRLGKAAGYKNVCSVKDIEQVLQALQNDL